MTGHSLSGAGEPLLRHPPAPEPGRLQAAPRQRPAGSGASHHRGEPLPAQPGLAAGLRSSGCVMRQPFYCCFGRPGPVTPAICPLRRHAATCVSCCCVSCSKQGLCGAASLLLPTEPLTRAGSYGTTWLLLLQAYQASAWAVCTPAWSPACARSPSRAPRCWLLGGRAYLCGAWSRRHLLMECCFSAIHTVCCGY